jgi:hypothetical protein
MHTIQTVIPTAVRPSTRSASTTVAHRDGSTRRRAARLLSAWAERRLLGTPGTDRAPAVPRRELPLPWA